MSPICPGRRLIAACPSNRVGTSSGSSGSARPSGTRSTACPTGARSGAGSARPGRSADVHRPDGSRGAVPRRGSGTSSSKRGEERCRGWCEPASRSRRRPRSGCATSNSIASASGRRSPGTAPWSRHSSCPPSATSRSNPVSDVEKPQRAGAATSKCSRPRRSARSYAWRRRSRKRLSISRPRSQASGAASCSRCAGATSTSTARWCASARATPRGPLTTPKSGKVRSVQWRRTLRRRLASLSQRRSWTADDDLVFVGPAGTYLDGRALRRRYLTAVKRAGLRPLRFHGLRHTFGTRMIAKADIRRVQEWMVTRMSRPR